MNKFVIILLSFFLLIAAVGFYLSGYNIIEAKDCAQEGGIYEVAFMPSIVLPMPRSCEHEYNDGGKKCISSDECEGSCLATEETRIQPGPGILEAKYIGGYGECQKDTRWDGCTRGTIEEPHNLLCT